jgi:hypothetical protein
MVDGTDELDLFEREFAFLDPLLEGLLVLVPPQGMPAFGAAASLGAGAAIDGHAAIGADAAFRAAVI